MTISQFLNTAVQKLRESGIESPRVDAEILLAFALGIRKDRLLIRLDHVLTQDELTRATALIEKRAGRVPLQHIVGTVEFMGKDFLVRPGVFIPRPETEFVVVEALKLLGHVTAPVVLDLCTASGVIGVSIAVGMPSAVVHAADVSSEAVRLAADNALRHGVHDRMRLHLGDLFAAEGLESIRGEIDLMTANPPYIPSSEIASLEPEVSAHEPLVALDGGSDGLVLARRILREGRPFLKSRGWFLIEIGAGQSKAVTDMAVSNGLEEVRTVRDLAGIERVLVARKR
ncbi:MAG: peptide chain release factor N(5)-glutamine methyltransferase [Candidatus Eisenbacteria bacterium]|nr:peptide chain release factor N(5)-glutamine methyltransferase [Candidatus Eisenbacteria bacterium]